MSDSFDARYYFTLQLAEAASDISVALHAGPLESYINGSAYVDDAPQDTQLTFRLDYDRRSMAINIVRRFVTSLPVAGLVLIFLLVPGATVLLWLAPKISLDPIEWLAVATGMSLSIYPLLIAYLRYTSVALSAPIVWGAFAVMGLVGFGGVWRQRKVIRPYLRLSCLLGWLIQPAYVALAIVLALSWLVRIMVIQGVDVPLWADSYHHTMLSQLIVDNGRLPSSWEPYAPLQSVNYHFGFHAMVAFFHWLTGETVIRSVLLFGQVLNFLAVVMAYLMGRRFGGNVWAGVFAALITGLISQYPMYYVNWGRYTQLAGQVILPVAMVLTWLLLEKARRDRALIIITILLVSGLALTHYRVILFYPCFVLPLILIRWYQGGRILKSIDLMSLASVAIGTGILALPRIVELAGSQIWIIKLELGRQGINNDYIREFHNIMLNLFDYVPPLVVILAGIGFAVGCWQQRSAVFAIGLWWLLLLVMTNPHLFSLPGSGMITNFAIYIGAYLVFAVLAGVFVGKFAYHLECFQPVLGWLLIVMSVLWALTGARQQLNMLDQAGILVTKPDLRAMVWINKELPSNAQFLTNARLSYGGYTVAGTDAGWWLPLIAGRQSITPPIIYGMEKPEYPEYSIDLLKRHLSLNEEELADVMLGQRMLAENINYVYIGQQRGRVWQSDEKSLDPSWLKASPLFDLIYADDGVRIFQVNLTKLEAA